MNKVRPESHWGLLGHQMSRRPTDTWCAQTLELGRGAISVSEASQAATGAQASTLSLESPLIPFHITCQHFPSPCFPALKSLSLCWLGCSWWLSSAEMKAHCPHQHKDRGLALPAASSAHTWTAGGEGTFTLLMKLGCPQWLTSILWSAPGVCHPGTVVSVHLPVQGFAPGASAGLPHVILPCLPPGGFRLKMPVHTLCTTVKTLVSPP